MASIIPGYEYDIFISYRQKDNKGDRWVSEFVQALKVELESTFKEDVSVYFDESPDDRLGETHDVDRSLHDKLKCLIFMPILSQTYCDTGSYAWKKEFVAFIEMAANDSFGKEIRLRNGNVAGRILPIRIHDLDQEDYKLFEKQTGSTLRAMDFVFKTVSGVSRPLLPNEDHPTDNLNKIYYRDQINKVGNAVKEILTSIKKLHQQNPKATTESSQMITQKPGRRKKKNIYLYSFILAVLAAGVFFLPGLLKDEVMPDKSIAVLPFSNLSNDPEQEYFTEGVVEAILNHLFKIGDLNVISSTSTKRYRNTELSIKEIARELGVSSILEGSVQKIGNNVRITAQLIDARSDVHLWSEIYDKDISNIFAIQSEVAQNIARELNAKLTTEEKALINKNQTLNTEAYNLYLQGRFHWGKRTKEGLQRSIKYFEEAIRLDPEYALAYAGLADSYFIQAWWRWIPWDEGIKKSREMVLKALEIDNELSEAHTVLGALLNYNDWKWEESRKELQLAVELKPSFVTAHQYYSELLDILGENEEARRQIDLAMQFDPFLPVLRSLSSLYYYHERKFSQVITEQNALRELDTEYPISFISFYSHIYQGEEQEALASLQEILKSANLVYDPVVLTNIYNESGISGLLDWVVEWRKEQPDPSAYEIARACCLAGRKEEALDWLEQAFENQLSSMPRIIRNPDFDLIRSEPRFQAIVENMGLSKYQDF